MDPISDMLNQLKNAGRAGQISVSVPFSNLKQEIAKVLNREGFLKAVIKKGKKVKKVLTCDLVYDETGRAKLQEVKRLSKPSRRVYAGAAELHPAVDGLMVVSTPKGVMTDREAKRANLGGEVLFKIW